MHLALEVLFPTDCATDARWYTREEVLAVIAHSETAKSGNDAPKWDSGVEEAAPRKLPVDIKEGPSFKFPPRNAMAGVLVSDWANGKVDISESIAEMQ